MLALGMPEIFSMRKWGIHENYAEQLCGAVFMLIPEGEQTNLQYLNEIIIIMYITNITY
jgi:hypothetical protein